MFFIKLIKNIRKKKQYQRIRKYKLYRLYELQCIFSKPIDKVESYLYDKEMDLILMELEFIDNKIKELKC